jgi:hypothetical protein
METAKLFTKIAADKNFDIGTALFCGNYMEAVAILEYNGIPIDIETLTALKENWTLFKEKLIQEIDAYFHHLLRKLEEINQVQVNSYLVQLSGLEALLNLKKVKC